MVIVPPHGGVADIGLSSYSPVRRRAATVVSDLKTSTSRFAHSIWGRGVHELLITVTPVDDGFVHAVCTGHQWKVHLGIVD